LLALFLAADQEFLGLSAVLMQQWRFLLDPDWQNNQAFMVFSRPRHFAPTA